MEGKRDPLVLHSILQAAKGVTPHKVFMIRSGLILQFYISLIAASTCSKYCLLEEGVDVLFHHIQAGKYY